MIASDNWLELAQVVESFPFRNLSNIGFQRWFRNGRMEFGILLEAGSKKPEYILKFKGLLCEYTAYYEEFNAMY
jgi:hypothetical protein